jgi:hypothetical protein
VLLRLITVEATESCRRTEDSGPGTARDGKTVNGVLAQGDNRKASRLSRLAVCSKRIFIAQSQF